MSTQNANELTEDQAYEILSSLANLDILKLNKKEHFAVQASLDKFKKLIESSKTQPDKVVELTPAQKTCTL